MIVEQNRVVSIEYEVKESGESTVLDSNLGSVPLTFLIGKQQVIQGLEDAMLGMGMGEKADLLIKAVNAYGELDESAFQTLPREQFAGIDIQNGMSLYGQDEQGGTVQVVVNSFDEENVTINFNHPLAGKDLMFSVNVTMIRDASASELQTGELAENMTDSSCGTDSGSSCGCH